MIRSLPPQLFVAAIKTSYKDLPLHFVCGLTDHRAAVSGRSLPDKGFQELQKILGANFRNRTTDVTIVRSFPYPRREKAGGYNHEFPGSYYYSREDRTYFTRRSASGARRWESDMGKEYKRLAGLRVSECRPVISEIYRPGCNHKSCSIE